MTSVLVTSHQLTSHQGTSALMSETDGPGRQAAPDLSETVSTDSWGWRGGRAGVGAGRSRSDVWCSCICRKQGRACQLSTTGCSSGQVRLYQQIQIQIQCIHHILHTIEVFHATRRVKLTRNENTEVKVKGWYGVLKCWLKHGKTRENAC